MIFLILVATTTRLSYLSRRTKFHLQLEVESFLVQDQFLHIGIPIGQWPRCVGLVGSWSKSCVPSFAIDLWNIMWSWGARDVDPWIASSNWIEVWRHNSQWQVGKTRCVMEVTLSTCPPSPFFFKNIFKNTTQGTRTWTSRLGHLDRLKFFNMTLNVSY